MDHWFEREGGGAGGERGEREREWPGERGGGQERERGEDGESERARDFCHQTKP